MSRLYACLTEANWWRLIAECNRLEAERTAATNIGLLYPKVRNNIGGRFPLTSPNQKIGGCVPGIPGGVDASGPIVHNCRNKEKLSRQNAVHDQQSVSH